MTKPTGLLLVLLFLGLLGDRLTGEGGDATVVRASRFVLVDKAGRQLGTWWVDDNGDPKLWMGQDPRSQDDMVFLASTDRGSVVKVTANKGKAQAWLNAEKTRADTVVEWRGTKNYLSTRQR